MSIKYSGGNVLTFLFSLLDSKFKTKVDKVDGKGLSTNDLSDTLKSNYDSAYAHSTESHAPSDAEKNVIVEIQKNGAKIVPTSDRKVDIKVPTKVSDLENDSQFITVDEVPEGVTASTTTPKVNGNASVGTENAFARGDHVHPIDETRASASEFKSHKEDTTVHITENERIAWNAKQDPATTLAGYGIKDAYTKNEVDAKLCSAYRPSGSVTFANLPDLSAENLGKVYNVTDAFNTTASFIEGAGKSYPANSNVAIVEVSEGNYKYDVLSGFVDLSGYTPTSDFVEYTNDEVQALWDAVFK